MIRRNFLTLVAALGVAAILGIPTQAQAAFRVTINATGAANPIYFYAASSNSAAFAGITAGNFTANIQTDSSNYSGTASLGSLSQTLIIGNSGAGGDIDVKLEVIASVAGLSDGQITDATQIANLTAAALLTWSLPVGNPVQLSSDVSVATNPSTTTGAVYNQTTANTTVLDSLTSGLNPADGARKTFTLFDASAGYTLTNHLIITGVNADATGTSLTGVSGVTPTPAPAGLVLLASAAPVLALGWLRRRQAQAQQA